MFDPMMADRPNGAPDRRTISAEPMTILRRPAPRSYRFDRRAQRASSPTIVRDRHLPPLRLRSAEGAVNPEDLQCRGMVGATGIEPVTPSV
jgi:hypothetical protein